MIGVVLPSANNAARGCEALDDVCAQASASNIDTDDVDDDSNRRLNGGAARKRKRISPSTRRSACANNDDDDDEKRDDGGVCYWEESVDKLMTMTHYTRRAAAASVAKIDAQLQRDAHDSSPTITARVGGTRVASATRSATPSIRVASLALISNEQMQLVVVGCCYGADCVSYHH
jgi:hypothetical protein